MEIYPSVLEQSAEALLDYISEHSDIFPHFQIDIADGIFVENTTISPERLAQKVTQNSPNLPVGTTFEFHLMVEDFASEIPHLETIAPHLPIREILVHYQPAVRWTQGNEEHLHELLHDTFPFKFGLSINPEVDISAHYGTLEHFETIQIMTIQPGGQGRPLIPEMLEKISELRSRGYEGRIILDGAMNSETLPKVLKQRDWPDGICPGSYLKKNTRARLEKLQQLVIEAGG